jgi:hypothetical protein
MTEFERMVDIIKCLVSAMKTAKEVGCVNYLDACDDSGDFWYKALERGEKAVSKYAAHVPQDSRGGK